MSERTNIVYQPPYPKPDLIPQFENTHWLPPKLFIAVAVALIVFSIWWYRWYVRREIRNPKSEGRKNEDGEI